MVSDEVKREVNSLFANSFAPSQPDSGFLINLKNNYENELNFISKKTVLSKCPRRRNINSSYAKCCQKHLEGEMVQKRPPFL